MPLRTLPIPPHKIANAYDAGMAGRNKRDVIRKDADGYPIINERTGEPREERIRRPASVKYVSKSGTVMYLRVTAGSGETRDPVMAEYIKEKMHRSQGIRYSTCPVRDELSRAWIPKEMRSEKPCPTEEFGRGKKYGAHCGCPHVERIIELRTKEHLKREKQKEAKFKPDEIKAEERQDALVAKLVAGVFGAKKGPASGG